MMNMPDTLEKAMQEAREKGILRLSETMRLERKDWEEIAELLNTNKLTKLSIDCPLTTEERGILSSALGNNTSVGKDSFHLGEAAGDIYILKKRRDDDGGGDFDFKLPGNVENLTLDNTANITGAGNTLDNIITSDTNPPAPPLTPTFESSKSVDNKEREEHNKQTSTPPPRKLSK
jgi:hypothetical protein